MKSFIVALFVVALFAVPVYALEGEVEVGASIVDDYNSDIDVENSTFVSGKVMGDYGMFHPYAQLKFNLDSMGLNTQSRMAKIGSEIATGSKQSINVAYKIDRLPTDQNINSFDVSYKVRF